MARTQHAVEGPGQDEDEPMRESLSRSLMASFRKGYESSQNMCPTTSKQVGGRMLGGECYLGLAACCYSAYLVAGHLAGLAVLYVPVLQQLSSSSAQASLVQSSAYLATLGGGAVAGLVTGRLGPGMSTMLGAVMAAIGCMASFLVQSVPALIGTAGILAGAGQSLVVVSAWSTLGLLSSRLPRASSSCMVFSFALGTFLTPYLYGALLGEVGWRGVYLIVAGLNLNAVPGGLLVFYMERRLGKGAGRAEGRTWRHLLAETVRPELVRDWRGVVYALCLVPIFATMAAPGFFLADMSSSLGVDIETASLSLVLMGAMSVAGRVVQAAMSYRRVPMLVQGAIFCLTAGSLSPAFALVKDQGALLAVSAAYGLTYGPLGVTPSLTVLEHLGGGPAYTAGTGYVLCMLGIGDFICGPVGGMIRDVTGSYGPIFYVTVATSYVCGGIFLLLHCSCKGRRLYRDSESVTVRVIREGPGKRDLEDSTPLLPGSQHSDTKPVYASIKESAS